MEDIKKYAEKEHIPTVTEGIEEPKMLVRCKDCKYWEVDNDVGFCVRTEDCDWNADDFCSRGERAE